MVTTAPPAVGICTFQTLDGPCYRRGTYWGFAGRVLCASHEEIARRADGCAHLWVTPLCRCITADDEACICDRFGGCDEYLDDCACGDGCCPYDENDDLCITCRIRYGDQEVPSTFVLRILVGQEQLPL
jgi:hypothetical protein